MTSFSNFSDSDEMRRISQQLDFAFGRNNMSISDVNKIINHTQSQQANIIMNNFNSFNSFNSNNKSKNGYNGTNNHSYWSSDGIF
jgi:hypothetical protein